MHVLIFKNIFFKSVDLFLWGALKSAVYTAAMDSEMDLLVRIICAAADIQQNASVLERVRQSDGACITNNGRNFEQLLWHFHISFTTAHITSLTNEYFRWSQSCSLRFLYLSCYFPMMFLIMSWYANLNPCIVPYFSLKFVPKILGHTIYTIHKITIKYKKHSIRI